MLHIWTPMDVGPLSKTHIDSSGVWAPLEQHTWTPMELNLGAWRGHRSSFVSALGLWTFVLGSPRLFPSGSSLFAGCPERGQTPENLNNVNLLIKTSEKKCSKSDNSYRKIPRIMRWFRIRHRKCKNMNMPLFILFFVVLREYYESLGNTMNP